MPPVVVLALVAASTALAAEPPARQARAAPDKQPQTERQFVHMVLPPDAVPVAVGPPSLLESAEAMANPAADQAIARLLGTAADKRSSLEARAAEPSRPGMREPPRVSRGERGWLRSVGAPPGQAFALWPLPGRELPGERAARFMTEYAEAFGIARPGVELRAERVKDRGERQYVRLQQRFKGLKVFAASVVVQLEEGGGVEFALSDVARDDAAFHGQTFDMLPKLAADAARALALTIPEYAELAKDLQATEPELMIYEPSVIGEAGPSRLVWHLEVTSRELPINELVLVDAQTAEVALYFSQIMHARNRQIYDCASVPGSTGSLARSEGQGPIGLADVDDAYDFLGDTYDFYWTRYSRDSIDGAGQIMVARVRYCPSGGPCPWENASWNGVEMKFGLGQAHADDTVAHELTHGVTSSESDLIYWGESGAINEALSDIFGEFVDLENGAGNDDLSVRWLLFEDAPDLVRRDMKYPTSPPYPGTNSPQPDSRFSPYWYSGYGDQRGVHINSGVGNKLAYLLTDGDTFNSWTVTGEGMSAVSALFYEAQTGSLLAPGSDYFDLYEALRQAAVNLSWTAAQRANLERACRAVEISYPGTPTTVTYQDFEGSFPPSGWTVSDNSGIGAVWGKDTSWFANGAASAWCAAGGWNAQPLGSYYINNMNTILKYGPFSLSSVDRAWLEFWVWSHVEPGFDYLFMGASTNGIDFGGYSIKASTLHTSPPANWSKELLDFSQVGGVVGQPNVWIALVFYSNSSNSSYFGTNIDDVLIRKASCVSPSAPTISAPSSGTSGVSYEVTWSITSPLNTYEIQEAADSGFTSPTTYQVSGISKGFTHTAGSPTTYYYRTRATDSCGGSTWSSSWSSTGQTTVSAASYTLTVSKGGTGSGTVSSSPAGIDCGSDCSESYTSGTVVTLSAAASGNSTFTGWSGEGCSGTGTCQVTMSQARAVTATFTAVACGQFIQQGGKLVGTGAVGGAQQGKVALSADGNTALVGGWYDNSNAGAAWVFTRSGGVWSQQGDKLVGTGAVGDAYQGLIVDLSADGNTAAVGGYGDNGNVGATWVFTRSGGVWSQQGDKLVGTGAVGASQQGRPALSADGNTLIVGAQSDDSNTGAAWVFTRSGGVWTQQGSKLVGTGAVGAAQQGRSVALSADGNTAIVGGDYDNGSVGAAWVFTRSGGVWSQQGSKLVGSGAVGDSYQGHHVALSADGNTALVGGYGDNSFAGAVWVFTRSGGVWSQQGSKLVGSGAVGKGRQGISVALSADGNIALVGAHADNSYAGATWVFTRSGGVWSQQGSKLVGSGAVGASEQGRVALSADGTTAMVGGQTDNSNAGATWVFVNPSQTLTVTKDGTGTGTVTSSPAGIDCRSTCSADFSCGQTVTLTAVADIGSTFTGWSGEGCSGTGTCQVTIDAAKNVTATFNTSVSCDVVLQSQTVSTNTLQESCGTIKVGPSFAVVSPGQLTLRAATYVALRNGFSVGTGARLTVALDPSLGGS